jgi:hypothetical protein
VGKTDAAGHYAFTYALPKSLIGLPLEQGNALVNFHVTVADTAGQQVTKDQLVTVASEPVNVVVVPESGELVAGVENRLLTFVTDPQGSPIPGAAININLGTDQVLSGTSDAYGQCVLAWTPATKHCELNQRDRNAHQRFSNNHGRFAAAAVRRRTRARAHG